MSQPQDGYDALSNFPKNAILISARLAAAGPLPVSLPRSPNAGLLCRLRCYNKALNRLNPGCAPLLARHDMNRRE